MKKQKGITLVALVVTIVVLLILAAVSINIAFGNNGIFTQAQKAAGDTAAAVDYEANELGQLMENFVKNSIGDTQTPTEEYYLVDQVEVGDYVAYDAGTWAETVGEPTSNATFGGYTAGTNKGMSVNSYNNSYKAPTDGWRVFSKSGSGATGVVTLISAGTPAQGYHEYSGSLKREIITALNNFANTNFVNSRYATSARNATEDDFYSSSELWNINSYYWLATIDEAHSPIDGILYEWLYFIEDDGGFNSTCFAYAYGVRPIVTLRSGVKTNETADTEFLGQTCWTLK